MTKKILFVCMGNICRSPAGEAVMQRFVEEFRVDAVVESAGTHGYHVGEGAGAGGAAAVPLVTIDVVVTQHEVHPLVVEVDALRARHSPCSSIDDTRTMQQQHG